MSKSILNVLAVGKRYRLYKSPHERLMAVMGLADRSRSHWALKDVSFQLAAGQCLGVIGDNGAGKSTLLKLLAGTLQPSHGSLVRVGRVTAILELGAGFHPDFTGRDNLMFAGGLIGLTQTDLSRLADDIIEFSELGEAIDRPVKTYSSGMVVRLAFALVTAVQPELLIIDEALAVGDQHFQKKCVERIEAFRANGCTILFCSHSLYHIRQLCDRVLWLDHGHVKGLGETEAILAAYETYVRLQDAHVKLLGTGVARTSFADTDNLPPDKWIANGRTAGLQHVRVKDLQRQGEAEWVLKAADLVIQVHAVTCSVEAPSVGVMLEQFQGVGITSVATHADGVNPTMLEQTEATTTWVVTLTFKNFPMHSGQYSLSFYLFDGQGLVVYDEWKDHITFHWVSPSLTPGLVRLPHQWS